MTLPAANDNNSEHWILPLTNSPKGLPESSGRLCELHNYIILHKKIKNFFILCEKTVAKYQIESA